MQANSIDIILAKEPQICQGHIYILLESICKLVYGIASDQSSAYISAIMEVLPLLIYLAGIVQQ